MSPTSQATAWTLAGVAVSFAHSDSIPVATLPDRERSTRFPAPRSAIQRAVTSPMPPRPPERMYVASLLNCAFASAAALPGISRATYRPLSRTATSGSESPLFGSRRSSCTIGSAEPSFTASSETTFRLGYSARTQRTKPHNPACAVCSGKSPSPTSCVQRVTTRTRAWCFVSTTKRRICSTMLRTWGSGALRSQLSRTTIPAHCSCSSSPMVGSGVCTQESAGSFATTALAIGHASCATTSHRLPSGLTAGPVSSFCQSTSYMLGVEPPPRDLSWRAHSL
mmetsp:Transcript_103490/g.178314  ORF Transcript_103490/g.178314 Transcript_103490/m.178314 type:complete len:281 (+) Transcript_103490:2285-3127(+)